MTKAVMTAQPGGTSTTMNTRQQATEADTLDERWKPSNGGGRQSGVTSDHSPFSPRRNIPKSLDRTSRRTYTSSHATPANTTPQQATNTTDKDLSLSKKQSVSQQRTPITATPIDNNHNHNNKETWKTVVSTTTPISELSQRLRRPTTTTTTTTTTSKSITGEPLTPTSKLPSGKSTGKEDSPASVSYSDSGKPRTGTALSTLNRSHQLKSSERLTDHQHMQQNGSSTIPNADETPSPGVNPSPNVIYTSIGSTEHGKPPKTPRSSRTANSRSDAIAASRQTTTTAARAGDSEAISIPAATYAMKVGPQTVMSQWMISLDDNLDEEGSDNQHSAKWEDAQEKLQRLVKDFIFCYKYKNIFIFILRYVCNQLIYVSRIYSRTNSRIF
jgi:hypothetical protein